MNIKPIKTEQDYEAALEEIERLFDAVPGTPRGDKLDILTTLVERYEEIKHPIDFPDPIDAINYVLESKGLTRRDLEACIGGRGRISEVLNRKRSLTLPMIRKLYEKFKIPARVLIRAS